MADSSNLGDDVDGAETHDVPVEPLAIFRALIAYNEVNFPCWPIRQVILL